MRPFVLILVAVAAFFALDLVANDGPYTHQVARSIQQAAAATGPAGYVRRVLSASRPIDGRTGFDHQHSTSGAWEANGSQR